MSKFLVLIGLTTIGVWLLRSPIQEPNLQVTTYGKLIEIQLTSAEMPVSHKTIWENAKIEGKLFSYDDFRQLIVGVRGESVEESWFVGTLAFSEPFLLKDDTRLRIEISSENKLFLPWEITLPKQVDVKVFPLVLPIREPRALRRRVGNVVSDKEKIDFSSIDVLRLHVENETEGGGN